MGEGSAPGEGQERKQRPDKGVRRWLIARCWCSGTSGQVDKDGGKGEIARDSSSAEPARGPGAVPTLHVGTGEPLLGEEAERGEGPYAATTSAPTGLGRRLDFLGELAAPTAALSWAAPWRSTLVLQDRLESSRGSDSSGSCVSPDRPIGAGSEGSSALRRPRWKLQPLPISCCGSAGGEGVPTKGVPKGSGGSSFQRASCDALNCSETPLVKTSPASDDMFDRLDSRRDLRDQPTFRRREAHRPPPGSSVVGLHIRAGERGELDVSHEGEAGTWFASQWLSISLVERDTSWAGSGAAMVAAAGGTTAGRAGSSTERHGGGPRRVSHLLWGLASQREMSSSRAFASCCKKCKSFRKRRMSTCSTCPDTMRMSLTMTARTVASLTCRRPRAHTRPKKSGPWSMREKG